MIFDFSSPALVDATAIVFPDVLFAEQPEPSDELLSTVYLTGTENNHPGSVPGSIEDG